MIPSFHVPPTESNGDSESGEADLSVARVDVAGLSFPGDGARGEG